MPGIIILGEIIEEEGPVIEEEAVAAEEAIAAEAEALAPRVEAEAKAVEEGAEAVAQKVEAEGEAILNQIKGALGNGQVGEVAPACPAATNALSNPTITADGLSKVVQHLEQFGEYGPNSAMVERLKSALDAGEPLTGADANFYLHELYESNMMAQGLDYEAAHQAALDFYSHSPFSLYHPDVIQTFPDSFNANWLQWWVLAP